MGEDGGEEERHVCRDGFMLDMNGVDGLDSELAELTERTVCDRLTFHFF